VVTGDGAYDVENKHPLSPEHCAGRQHALGYPAACRQCLHGRWWFQSVYTHARDVLSIYRLVRVRSVMA
jgi:hypothetical protein